MSEGTGPAPACRRRKQKRPALKTRSRTAQPSTIPPLRPRKRAYNERLVGVGDGIGPGGVGGRGAVGGWVGVGTGEGAGVGAGGVGMDRLLLYVMFLK